MDFFLTRKMAANRLGVGLSRISAMMKDGQLPPPQQQEEDGPEGWPSTVVDAAAASRKKHRVGRTLMGLPLTGAPASAPEAALVGFESAISTGAAGAHAVWDRFCILAQVFVTVEGHQVVLVHPLDPAGGVPGNPSHIAANKTPAWDPQSRFAAPRLPAMMEACVRELDVEDVFSASWILVGGETMASERVELFELLPVEEGSDDQPFAVKASVLPASMVLARLKVLPVIPEAWRTLSVAEAWLQERCSPEFEACVDEANAAWWEYVRQIGVDNSLPMLASLVVEDQRSSGQTSGLVDPKLAEKFLPEGATVPFVLRQVTLELDDVPGGITQDDVRSQTVQKKLWDEMKAAQKMIAEKYGEFSDRSLPVVRRALLDLVRKGVRALSRQEWPEGMPRWPSEPFYVRSGRRSTVPEGVLLEFTLRPAEVPQGVEAAAVQGAQSRSLLAGEQAERAAWTQTVSGESVLTWTQQNWRHGAEEKIAVAAPGLSFANPRHYEGWKEIVLHQDCQNAPVWVRGRDELGQFARVLPMRCDDPLTTYSGAGGSAAGRVVMDFLIWLYGASVTDAHRQIVMAYTHQSIEGPRFVRIPREAFPNLVLDTERWMV